MEYVITYIDTDTGQRVLCPEGPWTDFEDAQAFLCAEVGAPEPRIEVRTEQ